MASYDIYKISFVSKTSALDFLYILMQFYKKSWEDKEAKHMYFDEISINNEKIYIEFSFRWTSPDWVEEEILKFSKSIPKEIIHVNFFSEMTSEDSENIQYKNGEIINKKSLQDFFDEEKPLPLEELKRDYSVHEIKNLVVGENIRNKIKSDI